MTELQKHTVLELRQQGLKYREIAEHLGVTEAAIKMFLSRSQRARRCCENCGRLLPKNARKTQRFCSGACRHKWWNRNLDKLKNSNRTGHTCRICGKRFLSYKNAKYCSRTCYYKSRRKKHVNPRTRRYLWTGSI